MSGPPWTAPEALSDGLRAAGLWYGAATLVLAWIATAVTLGPVPHLVPLAVAEAAIAAGGVVFTLPVPRRSAPLVVLAAVVVMVAGFTAALLVLARCPEPPTTTAAFPLSPVKTAMLAFAVNAGRRRAPLLVGASLVVAAEAVSAVAGARLGVPWAFDLPETATLALIVVASSGFLIGGRLTERPGRASVAAHDEEVLTRTRSVARSRAAALVHDTVLGDLAAVSAAGGTRLPATTTAHLRRTLELLATADWTSAGAPSAVLGGPVLAAVARVRGLGLVVRVEGEVATLQELPPAVEDALAAAVEQCLLNTRNHAGTDAADVTVLADPDRLTVMVADSGSGFDPDRVDRARLGLATAVRSRVEEVGGSVRVFAQEGVGTTVLLSVPRGAAS